MFGVFSLDTSYFITTPSFSMQYAQYKNMLTFDLIRDVEIYSLIEKSIRGGFSCANIGKHKFNNPNLKEFDVNKEVTSGAFLDFNSLFAQVLSEKLPVGGLFELNLSEIESFFAENMNLNEEYAYMLLMDYKIPDHVKIKLMNYHSPYITIRQIKGIQAHSHKMF